MKVKLVFIDMVMLKSIIDTIPFTNLDAGKIIYKKYRDAMDKLVASRNVLIGKFETELEEEQTLPDGTKKMVKVKDIPEDKKAELNRQILELEEEIDFDGMTYAPVKSMIERFPSVVIDRETGEKGIKGEDDIVAYLNLKEKFI